MPMRGTAAGGLADRRAGRRRRAGRMVALLYALGAGVPSLGAQTSPFLPLDDPRVPLLEYLFLRGDVRDPSRMVRPVRTGDLVAALSESRPGWSASSSRLVERLRGSPAQPTPEAWWRNTPPLRAL